MGLIVAIGFGYWCWQSHLRDEIDMNSNVSSGAADEYAKSALRDYERLHGKTSRDRFAEAMMLDLNLNEGRAIPDPETRFRVVDGYAAAAQDAADLDWYEIAQIEHFVERNPRLLQELPHWDALEQVIQARPVKLSATKRQIKELSEASSKTDAHGRYVEVSKTQTSDKQNVHDSGVNEQLRGTLKRLRETTFPVADIARVKDEVSALVDREPDPSRRERARFALDTICNEGKFDGTIGANEKEVLVLVHARGNMPQNEGSADLMREALVTSLVDMSPARGSIVCDHGRAARLVESLVLLDADHALSEGAVSLEQIRNDAFAKSNAILQECVALATANTLDPAMAAVGRSYGAVPSDGGEVDAKIEHEFKENVKSKITRYIQDSYGSKMTSRDRVNLIEHCTLAIDTL